jgi:hypothetical protein
MRRLDGEEWLVVLPLLLLRAAHLAEGVVGAKARLLHCQPVAVVECCAGGDSWEVSAK